MSRPDYRVYILRTTELCAESKIAGIAREALTALTRTDVAALLTRLEPHLVPSCGMSWIPSMQTKLALIAHREVSLWRVARCEDPRQSTFIDASAYTDRDAAWKDARLLAEQTAGVDEPALPVQEITTKELLG